MSKTQIENMKKRILIVEDNESITDMLKMLLEGEDYDCTIANDGRNGLTLIENQKFDAVLLDIAMPGFSGLDVIDSLEKNGKLKENKIIVITASAVGEDTFEGLKKRGVHSILKKPVELDLLLNEINS